jgi:enoyl-CoA hydratase/carnithine racemase
MMTEQEATLLVEREDHMMILTLNRPDALNALNRDMQYRLEAAFREADADPDVRVIIITGTGRGFCSGADVGGLQAASGKKVQDMPPPFTARQCKVYKPVVCAINGMCAGAGLHFICDSDIVIASDKAAFTDTHVNVGQVSALEPIGLMQRMPVNWLMRLVILGKAERWTAQQALDRNLISEVVPHDNLLERAKELGRIISKVSPAAVKASIQAIWDAMDLPHIKAYELGLERVMRHKAHPDSLEGTTAFKEKRTPNWTT